MNWFCWISFDEKSGVSFLDCSWTIHVTLYPSRAGIWKSWQRLNGASLFFQKWITIRHLYIIRVIFTADIAFCEESHLHLMKRFVTNRKKWNCKSYYGFNKSVDCLKCVDFNIDQKQSSRVIDDPEINRIYVYI